MRRSRRLVPFVLVASVVVAAAWPTAGARAAGLDLPPPQLAKLQKLFDREVRPFGLRVSRGMLQSLETYEKDPEGTHLALYVEPIDDGYTGAQYVRNFTRLTRALVPEVFERWSSLESFDICQEPFEDPREVPPPTTQIFVARTALDRVGSWERATLRQLLVASPRTRDISTGYYVYFAPSLRDVPAFARAADRAGWATDPAAGED